MSNHDRSIAAETVRQNLKLIDRASAYWYACGYNDHRKADQPYVDPFKFADCWLVECAKPSHASLQDVFTAFERQAFIDRLTGVTPQTAAEARDAAIEWQHWMSEQSLSYGELAEWSAYFENIAARFPELREEFAENGII
jgi:hypothetical protein